MHGEPVTSELNHQPFRIGDWLVEPFLDQLTRGTEVHKLEPRTTRLLVKLAESHGKVVSSRELLDSVWSGVIVGPGSVYQAVSQLRKLFGEEEAAPTYIRTVPRRGYMLVGPIRLEAASGPCDFPSAPVLPTGSAAATLPAGVSTPRFLPRDFSRRYLWIALSAALLIAALIAIHYLPGEYAASGVSPPLVTAPASSQPLAMLPLRASKENPGDSLAMAMTSMLMDRLASVRGLTLIGMDSTRHFARADLDVRDAASKLNARYLLSGEVLRDGDGLRLSAELVDTHGNQKIWSKVFDGTVAGVTRLREDFVANVIDALRLPPEIHTAGAWAPVRLDAYQAYSQARELLRPDSTRADAERAAVLFERATTLDPSFARAYAGLAEALRFAPLLIQNPSGYVSPDGDGAAQDAVEQALRLDPLCGEAWIQRAEMTDKPREAEALFRKGLELAPNDVGAGLRFMGFLNEQGRAGEALQALDRVARIDPYSPHVATLRAALAYDDFGDVDSSIRWYERALSIDPRFATATKKLADVLSTRRGEFAEALRLYESIPGFTAGQRAGLATLYLEVDDPAAAIDVWESPPDPPPFRTSILWSYLGNMREASNVAERALSGSNEDIWHYAARVLRDEAVATGDYTRAMRFVEPAFARQQKHVWTAKNADRSLAIIYADLLILSGRRREGTDLAQRLLAAGTANEAGRPKGWFARERAQLYAMLGDDKRAVAELATSQRLNDWSQWWYTGTHDASFAHLHDDPKFRVLVEAARRQRDHQRALLEEMRRRGMVPRRGHDQGQ